MALRSGRRSRTPVVAAAPVVGVIVGVLTNLATERWNWLLLGLLVLASCAAAALMILIDRLPAHRNFANPGVQAVANAGGRTRLAF